MMLAGSYAEAKEALRVDSGAFRGRATYLIGSVPASGVAVAPQAFIAEQTPQWVLQPHFHLTAQFQVVVAGSGSLGTHALEPVTVHYAAPQSGYGPLSAGPNGLSYLTIRLQTDRGIWCLPQEKDRMEHPRKRFHGFSSHVPVLTAHSLGALSSVLCSPVLERLADGAEALLVELPPGASRAVDRSPDCGHHFYVVLSGSILFNSKSLPAPSVAFASEDERQVTLSAERAGAQVLMLVFRSAGLVRTDPASMASVDYAVKEPIVRATA
jgi:hypothetical protein